MLTIISAIDKENGIATVEEEPLYTMVPFQTYIEEITKGQIIIVEPHVYAQLPLSFSTGRKIYVYQEEPTNDYPKIVSSIEAIQHLAMNYQVYVLGGETLYNEVITIADELILAQVYLSHPHAYYFFPDFTYETWKLLSHTKASEPFPFGVSVYQRKEGK